MLHRTPYGGTTSDEKLLWFFQQDSVFGHEAALSQKDL
jgi:hypothetical protein